MQEVDKLLTHSVGVGAAGGISTPTQVYGEFLTTHGFWLLSYAEWMKIFGTIYISILLIRMAGSSFMFAKLMSLFKKTRDPR